MLGLIWNTNVQRLECTSHALTCTFPASKLTNTKDELWKFKNKNEQLSYSTDCMESRDGKTEKFWLGIFS